jgi:hypothetical protein
MWIAKNPIELEIDDINHATARSASYLDVYFETDSENSFNFIIVNFYFYM